MMRRIAAALLPAVMLAMAVCLATPALTAEARLPEEVEAVLKQLISTPKERVAFRAGKIATSDVESLGDNAISAAVAMLVPTPYAAFAERFCRKSELFAGVNITASGRLTPPADPAQLEGVLFTSADRDEIRRIVQAQPGMELNLSPAEIARLREEVGGLADSADAEAAQAVSRVYRLLLSMRFRDYTSGGAAAVAPYVRAAGATASPARELRVDLARVAPVLARYRRQGGAAADAAGGGISAEADGPPAGDGAYWWIKRTLQDRPLYALVHQVVDRGDGFCVIEQRHFYVGHSYNSLQSVSLMLPAGERTAVFTLNSTATDQVLGVLGTIGRPVAQQRLRASLEEGFVEVRAQASR